MCETNHKRLLFTLIFVILTTLTFDTYFFIYPSIKKYTYEKQTNNTEIKVVEDTDIEGGIVYYPIYYFNISNVTYECKSNYKSTSYPDFSKNLVYYNPSNPENCLTQHEISKSLFDNIFYIFGSIITIGGSIIVTVREITCNCKKKEDIDEPVNNDIDEQRDYYIDNHVVFIKDISGNNSENNSDME